MLAVSSSQLVAQFRLEAPLAMAAARLPPAMLGAPPPPPPAPRALLPAPPAPTLPPPPPAPPLPRWSTSLRLRADLRVFRSDYTEPYSVWCVP